MEELEVKINKLDIQKTLKHVYQGDNFYIYQIELIPQGPWLYNGLIETKFYYKDEMKEELLEIKETLIYNDGGTIVYKFTNNSKLLIPHNNKLFENTEILRYNNNKLNEIKLN